MCLAVFKRYRITFFIVFIFALSEIYFVFMAHEYRKYPVKSWIYIGLSVAAQITLFVYLIFYGRRQDELNEMLELLMIVINCVSGMFRRNRRNEANSTIEDDSTNEEVELRPQQDLGHHHRDDEYV